MNDNDPIYFYLEPAARPGYWIFAMAVCYVDTIIEFYRGEHNSATIENWALHEYNTPRVASRLTGMTKFQEIIQDGIDSVNKDLFNGAIND